MKRQANNKITHWRCEKEMRWWAEKRTSEQASSKIRRKKPRREKNAVDVRCLVFRCKRGKRVLFNEINQTMYLNEVAVAFAKRHLLSFSSSSSSFPPFLSILSDREFERMCSISLTCFHSIHTSWRHAFIRKCSFISHSQSQNDILISFACFIRFEFGAEFFSLSQNPSKKFIMECRRRHTVSQ